MPVDRLIKMPRVEDKTGSKRSHIYALIAAGKFPRPVKVGARAVAWRESDVDAWIASLEEA